MKSTFAGDFTGSFIATRGFPCPDALQTRISVDRFTSDLRTELRTFLVHAHPFAMHHVHVAGALFGKRLCCSSGESRPFAEMNMCQISLLVLIYHYRTCLLIFPRRGKRTWKHSRLGLHLWPGENPDISSENHIEEGQGAGLMRCCSVLGKLMALFFCLLSCSFLEGGCNIPRVVKDVHGFHQVFPLCPFLEGNV